MLNSKSVTLLLTTLAVAFVAPVASKEPSLRANGRRLAGDANNRVGKSALPCPSSCQGDGCVASMSAEAALLVFRSPDHPEYCAHTEQCVQGSCCIGAGRNACVVLSDIAEGGGYSGLPAAYCQCESTSRVSTTPAPTPAPMSTTPAPTPAPMSTTPTPTPAPMSTTPAPTPAPTPATPAPTPAPMSTTPAPTPAPMSTTPAPTPAPMSTTPAPVFQTGISTRTGNFDCPSQCEGEDCKVKLSAEECLPFFRSASSHPNEYCEHTGQCEQGSCCIGAGRNCCIDLNDVTEEGEEPVYPGLRSDICQCLAD